MTTAEGDHSKFFDTNVVVYLASDDPHKADISRKLMREGGVVRVQVLTEFTSVARRKYAMDWAEIRTVLDGLKINCSIVPLTDEMHARALDIAERHKLNIYDGMVVAAAALAGCPTLYSEDMHDGLVIDGVTIRNPYTP